MMFFCVFVNEFNFFLEYIVGYENVVEIEKFVEVNIEMVGVILDEVGKFCFEVLVLF